MKQIYIFGSGGHAISVADAVEAQGKYKIAAFVSHDAERNLPTFSINVIKQSEIQTNQISMGVVAVGDNWLRKKIVSEIKSLCPEFEFINVLHPHSFISPQAELGSGNVILSGANVGPLTRVADHCIINSKANVDHQCELGNFCSIAPGGTLGGNVVIGDFTSIGISACVHQGIKIGEHSVIGSLSLVNQNINSMKVAYGIPAKEIRVRAIGEKYL